MICRPVGISMWCNQRYNLSSTPQISFRQVQRGSDRFRMVWITARQVRDRFKKVWISVGQVRDGFRYLGSERFEKLQDRFGWVLIGSDMSQKVGGGSERFTNHAILNICMSKDKDSCPCLTCLIYQHVSISNTPKKVSL